MMFTHNNQGDLELNLVSPTSIKVYRILVFATFVSNEVHTHLGKDSLDIRQY